MFSLVRLYVQLGEESEDEHQVRQAEVTPDVIFHHAMPKSEPYKLNYQICEWHSSYKVS